MPLLLQKFLLTNFTIASSSLENYNIFTTVNLKCELVERHKKNKHRTGSNQKSTRFYDAIANHRIGITNHWCSRFGKHTKVAKKKTKMDQYFCLDCRFICHKMVSLSIRKSTSQKELAGHTKQLLRPPVGQPWHRLSWNAVSLL